LKETVFNRGYANLYDHFYWDKDYASECDLLEYFFTMYKKNRVKSILDLGCGTGNHSILLAKRGYEVCGVDFSEDMRMVAIEKTSLEEVKNPPSFVQGDIRSIELGKQFDAVSMFFAVLGYQITNEDVIAALKSVRRHLKIGGLFIFDVWYGPAVLSIRPSERIKIIPTDDGKIIRTVSSSLDIIHHLTEVHYHIWKLSGDQVISEIEETHTMRFFFPMELELFLSNCGLKLEIVKAFPIIEEPVDESTWNIICVAR